MWEWFTTNDNATAVAVVIAAVALVQPWIIWLVAKFKHWRLRQNAKIILLPNKKMSVHFDDEGLYLHLHTSLISEHTENVVDSIIIKIKDGNNEVYNFEWHYFEDPYFYNSKYAKETNEYRTYAFSVYLEKDRSVLQKIRFVDHSVNEDTGNFVVKKDKESLASQIKFASKCYDVVFEVKDKTKKPFTTFIQP